MVLRMRDGRSTVSEEQVVDVLRQVVDPELGINIVDLGLVYSMEVAEGSIRVVMTMTTPACPMNVYLSEAVEAALRARCPQAHSVRVDVVWDPPWDPHMMSDLAKQELGWAG